MTEPLDYVVVGGGIVGASTAHHLLRSRPGAQPAAARQGADLRRCTRPATTAASSTPASTTSPAASRPRCAGAGARLTEEYAAAHDIPVVRTGKLLVATDDRELGRPGAPARAGRGQRHRGRASSTPPSSVAGSRTCAAWRRSGCRATGITDYRRDQPGAGRRRRARPAASCAPVDRVTGVTETGDEVRLATDAAARSGPATWSSAPGVQADRLARLAGLDLDLAIVPFRGEYYDVVPREGRPGLAR